MREAAVGRPRRRGVPSLLFVVLSRRILNPGEKCVAATTDVKSRILSRGDSPNGYQIYRAGLEWDLAEPIVIESEAGLQIDAALARAAHAVPASGRQSDHLLPAPAGDVARGRCRARQNHQRRSRHERTHCARTAFEGLIVAPKILAEQWKEELETSSTFGPLCHGPRGSRPTRGDRRSHHDLQFGADISRPLPEDRFQMLILDEAHKLRNLYGVPTTPKVASTFRRLLKRGASATCSC